MYRQRRLNEGTPIPRELLRIGMSIHLKGTDFGCVWQITMIESQNAAGEVWLWAKTPVSGKYVHANASRARYIRADQPR